MRGSQSCSQRHRIIIVYQSGQFATVCVVLRSLLNGSLVDFESLPTALLKGDVEEVKGRTHFSTLNGQTSPPPTSALRLSVPFERVPNASPPHTFRISGNSPLKGPVEQPIEQLVTCFCSVRFTIHIDNKV